MLILLATLYEERENTIRRKFRVNTENAINERVSKYKPLTGKPPPGDKRPGIEPDINFHDLVGNDNDDRGYEALILV